MDILENFWVNRNIVIIEKYSYEMLDPKLLIHYKVTYPYVHEIKWLGNDNL